MGSQKSRTQLSNSTPTNLLLTRAVSRRSGRSWAGNTPGEKNSPSPGNSEQSPQRLSLAQPRHILTLLCSDWPGKGHVMPRLGSSLPNHSKRWHPFRRWRNWGMASLVEVLHWPAESWAFIFSTDIYWVSTFTNNNHISRQKFLERRSAKPSGDPCHGDLSPWSWACPFSTGRMTPDTPQAPWTTPHEAVVPLASSTWGTWRQILCYPHSWSAWPQRTWTGVMRRCGGSTGPAPCSRSTPPPTRWVPRSTAQPRDQYTANWRVSLCMIPVRFLGA